MTYDYRNTTEEIWELIEHLNDRQIREVEHMIKDFIDKEQQDKKQRYMDWLETMVMPVLQELSENISSYLEISREDYGLHVCIKKDSGLNVDCQRADIKVVLLAASYVNISVSGYEVQIELVYSCE